MALTPSRKAKATEQKPAAKEKKTAALITIALKPRVSEKAYAMSEKANTYIFDVPSTANKHTVASAVTGQFDVGVTNVRLATIPGKAVRSYRNRGRKSISAKRADVRKAYVTLKEGDKLPIFAAVENPDAPKETK